MLRRLSPEPLFRPLCKYITMYVCMCVHIYIHTYIYVIIGNALCVCVYIYIYTYIVYYNIFMITLYIYIYIYIHLSLSLYIYVYIHIYIYIYNIAYMNCIFSRAYCFGRCPSGRSSHSQFPTHDSNTAEQQFNAINITIDTISVNETTQLSPKTANYSNKQKHRTSIE